MKSNSKTRVLHNALYPNPRPGLPEDHYQANDHASLVQSDQIKGLLANMTFAQQELPSPLPQAGQVIVNRSQLPNPHGLFNVSDKVLARQAIPMQD